MSNPLERCANCDAVIGRLETPYVWQDQVVCSSCHNRLTTEQPTVTTAASVPVLSYSSAVTPQVTPPQTAGDPGLTVICPNVRCGYSGPGLRVQQGSCLIFCFLLLLGILPAIIYSALCRQELLICPKCGMQIRKL